MLGLSAYESCRLCPRRCGVNRAAGKKGKCGETAVCRIGSYGPHFGEEPPFSGTRGSGTFFFSGCSSGCFFCQNYQISLDHLGRDVTVEDLETFALEMVERQGVHNINFVTADHFWPHVAALAKRLKDRKVDVPLLYNCSGFQDPELVSEYAECIHIFVPDFKYADPELARYCMGDERYPEMARKAIAKMIEARGFLVPWDPTGATPAREGVLVRHLVFPGYVENSLQALTMLREEFGRSLPISVMSQYRPTPRAAQRPPFDRRLTADEYRRVLDLVVDLEFRHVFIQSLEDSTDFFPDFTSEIVFRGNVRGTSSAFRDQGPSSASTSVKSEGKGDSMVTSRPVSG